MLYQAELTIPPNTPEYNPVRVTISPTVGLLTGIDLNFPDGCLGAVGVRIVSRDRKIAPLPSGWIKDNNNRVAWNEFQKLEGAPWSLTIEGYSIALDWSHTITARFYLEKG